MLAGRDEVIAFVPRLQAGGTYDFAISSIDEYPRPAHMQHKHSQCGGRHNKEGEKGRSRRVELVWEPVVEEKPFKPAYVARYIPPAPVVAPYIPPVVAPAQKRSSVSHASHEIICGDLPETNEIVVKDGEEYTWVTARCGPDGGLQSAVVAVCTTPSLILAPTVSHFLELLLPSICSFVSSSLAGG